MIETNKEWKRALKGAGIFVGSVIVLFCVLFTFYTLSEDSEPESEAKEIVKSKETYSLKQEYKDYLIYRLVPLLNEDDKIMEEYKLLVNPSFKGEAQEYLTKYGEQLEVILPQLENLISRQQKVQTKTTSLSLSKKFPKEDKKLFNETILIYSQALDYQIQYIQSTVDFTKNYQDSNLSFIEYLSKDTEPFSSFEHNNQFLLEKSQTTLDSFFDSLNSFNSKYNIRIKELIQK